MKIIGVKVTGRTGVESDFGILSLFEINYISVFRPKKSAELIPVYHTTTGSYAPLLTLKDISSALKQFGFEYFDKSTIVNKNRVKQIRRSKGELKVTFVDNSEIPIALRSRYR
ncbi:LytTR family transcriptional regulator DNA-binding domain-containing protein [Paenibacillus pini]|uniref:LytTR family transcriptional regulator DNA-binding domain-containing protein n=1 Tax=Paenibacillus pini TaxID=669461 RepID=UPI000568F9B9|nr:LytTR family transcriptional regulator DNA-binding domain-containing protein [Paenibacillus pini]